MIRSLVLGVLLSFGVMWGQDAGKPASGNPPEASPPSTSQRPSPAKSFPFPGDEPEAAPADTPPADAQPADTKPSTPDLSPPRSDSVKAGDLGNSGAGESSSKSTQIDLTPPEDDARKHPQSAEAVLDAEASATGHVTEFHTWDPHKAAKSVEVGDFYFKRKNYRAAEDRYREALGFKDNDAVATFRLAICLEKLNHSDDARQEYESYLRIVPHGELADEAQKAIERLKKPVAAK